MISMAETFAFRSPSLVTCSVQMLMPCNCASFKKAHPNSSTVSTALQIARPLALMTILFEPAVNDVKQAIT